jgi:HPt (histidine-containing phosphotransfer) domain-containing protein
MSEREPIDTAVLNGLLGSVGGDLEFLGELLATYFDDSPNQLATMHAALAAGDADQFRRAAHSLKSNSASFGAMALSGLCKSLEDLGKAGTLQGAGELLAQAEQEYGRVQAALQAAAG